jgi:CubicO group peptidase (beta-lactamase class C family)
MSRLVSIVAAVAVIGCNSSSKVAPVSPDAAIARVTAGLLPPVAVAGSPSAKYSLSDRMAFHKVPGVSIAVVDSGQIVWAKGFGVKETGTTDSVTPTTMFQAASISKPVAATAMLRLVEDGKLNLDQDVNVYLTSWKVPENKYTKVHKPTLRRIVSHNAGFTVHGFPGYAAGDSLPTVPQILDGKKPANTGPVRIDTTPGMLWRYSGGGITVEQLAMMDVTGEPFAALVKRLVLDPVGMTNSTYEQPFPEALRSQSSAAHEKDGTMTPGRWHTYPEQAAAGLWTTPTDLLKWALSIASAWEGGGKTGVLSNDMAKRMLTVTAAPSGLGPMLGGRGKGFYFEHGGANQGFRCQLIYFPEIRKGAAVMTNGENGGALAKEVLYALAAEYGWVDYGPKQVTVLPIDQPALAGYSGKYVITKPQAVTLMVTNDGAKLYAELVGFGPKSEVVFSVPNKGIALASGQELTFLFGKTGTIDEVETAGYKFRRTEK